MTGLSKRPSPALHLDSAPSERQHEQAAHSIALVFVVDAAEPGARDAALASP